MANCKYCGKWAGINRDEHEDCAKLAAEGRSPQEIWAMTSPAVAPPAPLTPVKIFWSVFWALWCFSLSAAIIAGIFRAILSSK